MFSREGSTYYDSFLKLRVTQCSAVLSNVYACLNCIIDASNSDWTHSCTYVHLMCRADSNLYNALCLISLWPQYQDWAINIQCKVFKVFPRATKLTWHLQHLHSVQQGRGDSRSGVGRGDEEHLREIKSHIEIVVCEAVVLLRVEHLRAQTSRVSWCLQKGNHARLIKPF